ncbi:hypothetical protein QQS21_006004 [Conoideocrella luteorostrata]|uniref:DUF7600 domain-containing protein n=1 Tax=Conoideocrella luteorostrata TaxID=1105319 RepID=A0AAJ0CR45_9HYPO|nr:hypothetical protein QQS21_006004 [Conoideocrella luteorostrata]
MSPQTHSCVLCGYTVGHHHHHDGQDSPWTALFRIHRVAVTGVGLFNDAGASHLVAPLDFGARWDTSESSVQIGVVRQLPVNGRYGFPFHEACWLLLEQAHSPALIPQRRLFDVCRSLPFSDRMDCITWDHDYGGLVSADNDSYPWEDLFVDQELAFASNNPYLVPEIEQLPNETPILLEDIPMMISKSADIFARFPLEIITMISLYLPTVDYLNARLSLPSFYPVFYTQEFWASRFLLSADRSWVFESRNWEIACNWLWFYRRTANGSPSIKNRERVWRLVEKVKKILCLEWIEPISYSVTDDAANSNWLKAAGDLRPETNGPYQGFTGGCRQFHEKHVYIPPDQLSHLAFSLIKPGNATYITGIKVILIQGEAIQLGYKADEERILNITCLTGFNVAVGSRGIQGIQCILDNDQESSWIGCPDTAPKTRRLGFVGPITSIKAAFDGYKMVSLAANGCIRPGQDKLRSSAFWYPRIPEMGLHLNESGFTAGQTAMIRYDPICWTRFGGPAGMYLRLLSGISVTADAGCLRAIEFHYNDNEGVPLECRKVGRCTPSEYAKTMHFEVDGLGGEVIDSLIVYIRQYPNTVLWYLKPGVLESFKACSSHSALAQSNKK